MSGSRRTAEARPTIDLSEETTFFDETDVAVAISIRSGGEGTPLEGAVLGVRLLDPRSKPAKVFEGKTTSEGSVDVQFRIPDLGGAQGALVFQARHGGRAAELTRPVLPRR
jgi:hypothetical protein